MYYRRDTNDREIIEEVVTKAVYFRKIAKECMTGPDRGKAWVDLGMHIGVFASIAVAHGCLVYGFEPERSNFELARENIALN